MRSRRRLRQQPGQPHQVVCGGREGERQVDPVPTAEPGLAEPCYRLDPAERLLDPLADALAGGLAGMTGGAPVDRRATVVGVLRQVRAHVQLTQFHHEVAGVIERWSPWFGQFGGLVKLFPGVVHAASLLLAVTGASPGNGIGSIV